MAQKNLGKKDIWLKKIGTKNILVQKNFESKNEKKLGTKKIGYKKNFGAKNIWVQKNVWSIKIKTPKNWVPKVWSKSDQ